MPSESWRHPSNYYQKCFFICVKVEFPVQGRKYPSARLDHIFASKGLGNRAAVSRQSLFSLHMFSGFFFVSISLEVVLHFPQLSHNGYGVRLAGNLLNLGILQVKRFSSSLLSRDFVDIITGLTLTLMKTLCFCNFVSMLPSSFPFRTTTYLLVTNRKLARRNLVVLRKILELLDRLRLGHGNGESDV